MYLANLMLVRTEHDAPEDNRPNNDVSFKVLEIDSQLDEVAVDSVESDSNPDYDIGANDVKMMEIRKKKGLFEKA